jgi:hypothetical protein
MTTHTKIHDIPRSVDAGTLPGPDNPPGYPPTWPRYDPYHLLGEVVARLELQGQLPPESVPKDIEAAVEACRTLLVALGMLPVLVSAVAA